MKSIFTARYTLLTFCFSLPNHEKICKRPLASDPVHRILERMPVISRHSSSPPQFHHFFRFAVRSLPVMLLLMAVQPPAPAMAHPHIFIDCKAIAVFDASGLTGFQQTWIFDEMFSAGMLMEYDTNGDQQFNAAETAKYAQEIFSILKEYNYLTVLRVDGEEIHPHQARDFRPEVRNGQLIYHFFTPCVVPFASGTHNVAISVYDPEYYADMVLLDSAVSVEAPPGVQTAKSNVSAPELTYFGCIVPVFINLRFSAP